MCCSCPTVERLAHIGNEYVLYKENLSRIPKWLLFCVQQLNTIYTMKRKCFLEYTSMTYH